MSPSPRKGRSLTRTLMTLHAVETETEVEEVYSATIESAQNDYEQEQQHQQKRTHEMRKQRQQKRQQQHQQQQQQPVDPSNSMGDRRMVTVYIKKNTNGHPDKGCTTAHPMSARDSRGRSPYHPNSPKCGISRTLEIHVSICALCIIMHAVTSLFFPVPLN